MDPGEVMDEPLTERDEVIQPLTLDGSGARRRFAFAREVFPITKPNSAQTESIALLRNFMIGQHMRAGRRALAVCAPLPKVGSTFVSVNLAVSLAQAGVNTLLIDSNLHDPGVQALVAPIGPTPAGLSEYLVSRGGQAPQVAGDVITNLSILFAGNEAEAGRSLLATNIFKDLLEESIRSFDLTIVDCAPAAQFSDARRVASVLRHALVVARQNETYAADIKTLVGELKQDRVNVVGSYLNVIP